MLIFPVYHNSHPLEKKYFQIIAYDHWHNLSKGVSNDLGLIVLHTYKEYAFPEGYWSPSKTDKG